MTPKLLDELPQGISMAAAQEQVLAYITKWVPELNKARLHH
ncbi:oligoribonuclease (3'-5' exoribonuclease) [Arthrobacter sp. CAN_A6]